MQKKQIKSRLSLRIPVEMQALKSKGIYLSLFGSNNPFFQDYIGVYRFFTCSNNCKCLLCPFIELKSFHKFNTDMIPLILLNYPLVYIPYVRLHIISRHNT